METLNLCYLVLFLNLVGSFLLRLSPGAAAAVQVCVDTAAAAAAAAPNFISAAAVAAIAG